MQTKGKPFWAQGFLTVVFFAVAAVGAAQFPLNVKTIFVDSGWAANGINTTVFRKNSLVSFADTQFISFYNKDGFVVLAKRRLGETKWTLKQTPFKGKVADAHNVISIMIDGNGFLHVAWDHHNNSLHYAKSVAPGSLDLQLSSMTGLQEAKVSYPEFYKLPNGDLLFFYRDGGSGNGNLVINKYSLKRKTWTQLQSNLIDGEGKRNAYWQACVDGSGTIHLSWVWRESPDVASNHDLCYARSKDGGLTWQNSNGENYTLPITEKTAEPAQRIPQRSELINQTSMTTDAAGRPFIAGYWRSQGDSVPQYRIVYRSNDGWKTVTLAFRKTPFSLSGQGSKRLPIARPQLLVKGKGEEASALLVFRDEERGSKVSVARIERVGRPQWQIFDLTKTAVGSWEPTYDTELWRSRKHLHLFLQAVEQADSEDLTKTPPQMVKVLEWKP